MVAEFERHKLKDLIEIDNDLRVMRKLPANVIAFHELLHNYVQTRFEHSVDKPPCIVHE